VKTVSMEEFRSHVDQFLEETSQGDVVLTRDGEPWVVIRAVAEDLDRDSARFANSAEFWQMIHLRRQEQGIPWEDAEKQLDAD
jgi:antitoxin (DNA-binding transcriptional repressor) of toxin-antitoxin stability system